MNIFGHLNLILMKYLLRVVYERFYGVKNKTLVEAKEEVVKQSVNHISSLANGKTHSVFNVEEYTPSDVKNVPHRRKNDVVIPSPSKIKDL